MGKQPRTASRRKVAARWQPRRLGAGRLAVLTIVAGLVCAASAFAAIAGLPPGVQVNSDLPAIDPAQDAGLTDLSAGTVIAGNARVPWAAFSQKSGASQQIFVRAFKGGTWQTQGFPESLNEDATQVAQAPSIDFTGANRTVPWVGWAEPSTVLGGHDQIFASRFVPQPAPAQGGGQWIHEGQQVTSTAPSLNINTNRDAAAPSLIGGTTTAGGNPAPWLTWQEFDGEQNLGACNTAGPLCAPQIFVSHAVPATAGACPAGTKPDHGSSVGNFCFQQVGLDRVQGPAVSQLDPSLNIDPSRSGIEGDIAFTGPNDTVPWVVWYENSDSNNGHPSTHGLFDADMVFAARAIADNAADGKFHWQVVGLGTAGKDATHDILNNSGANLIGECGASTTNEQACSLDAAPASGLSAGTGGENPTVTAGTMVAGKNTTPWIAWDESTSNGGLHSVFVARLDAAGDHFDLLNNGQPISHSGLDSTRPDIVFSHNTPYVSWHEKAADGTTSTFVGHFEGNPANPVFHIDTGAIPTTKPVTSDDGITDVRQPVASTCPADPFTQDGATCPGNAVGTPFFAFTNTTHGPRALFAQTYEPENVQTGSPTGVGISQATVSGSANPAGAPAHVHFDFGKTTSYGSSTADQSLSPGENQASFNATLTGLPANTTIHYRAVATSDFGTFAGADKTFKTASTTGSGSAGRASVKGTTVSLRLTCRGASGASCRFALTLTVTEKLRRGKPIAITSRRSRTRKVTVTVGSASATLAAGQSKVVKVSLNRTGRRLLARFHRLSVTLKVTQSLGGRRTTTIKRQVVTFKASRKGHKH
jgi:hypothetical protein